MVRTRPFAFPGIVLMTMVAMTLCMTTNVCGLQDEPPPVFDNRPYSEARNAAEEEKKWFIVKGTAEWCGPCKQMDATTWRDEKVVAWLKEHAIAVAVDVDKHKAVARDLKIRAMPTMIAFKDGKEFDRVVGYSSPADFLVWLEGMAQGKKSIEAVRERAQRPDESGHVNVDARRTLARELAQRGDYEEAAKEYVWLWKHMLDHEPAMVGVRGSFMASEMKRLAQSSEHAMAEFRALRDNAAARIKGEKVETDDVNDWIVLNEVIGDEAATLTWFDRMKMDARWLPVIQRVSFRLDRLLLAHERWADMGKLLTDPVAQLEREELLLEMTIRVNREHANVPAAQLRRLEHMASERFREKVGVMYASLLAAKREDDASKLVERARRTDASPEMVRWLVSTALRAEQPRDEHLTWIEQHGNDNVALHVLANEVRSALR